MNKLEVIAWDLDGTLYPTTPALNQHIEQQLVVAIARQLNSSLDAAATTYAYWKKQLHSSTKVLNQLGLNGNQFFIDLWAQLPLEDYLEQNPVLNQLLLDTTQCRHILHTNSNTLASVRRKLACLSLDETLFSKIITLPWQGYQKPDRPVFELLLTEAAVPADHVLYVGDRIEVDLLPAHQLGMRTALISQGELTTPAWLDAVFNQPITVLQALKECLV
jgi:HAD superfamily hydrolase (TIGR01549 family)